MLRYTDISDNLQRDLFEDEEKWISDMTSQGTQQIMRRYQKLMADKGCRVYNGTLSYFLRPSWIQHNSDWSPRVDPAFDRLASDALSPALEALRILPAMVSAVSDFPKENVGCVSISSDAYQESYQAIMQIGVFADSDLNETMWRLSNADMQALGYSPIDNHSQLSSRLTISTGIVPMDSLREFTALRIIQAFVQHDSDIYVIRFNSYIPTPNDDCSYDDYVFFGCPSKAGFTDFVLNQVRTPL